MGGEMWVEEWETKFSLKTHLVQMKYLFSFLFALYFFSFKNTCETLLKKTVRVQREHFILKGRGESSVEPKPSMVLHYLCLLSVLRRQHCTGCAACFGVNPAVTTASIHGSLWGVAGQLGLYSRRNSLCGDKSVL